MPDDPGTTIGTGSGTGIGIGIGIEKLNCHLTRADCGKLFLQCQIFMTLFDFRAA